jgi:hypothetical protein
MLVEHVHVVDNVTTETGAFMCACMLVIWMFRAKKKVEGSRREGEEGGGMEKLKKGEGRREGGGD